MTNETYVDDFFGESEPQSTETQADPVCEICHGAGIVMFAVRHKLTENGRLYAPRNPDGTIGDLVIEEVVRLPSILRASEFAARYQYPLWSEAVQDCRCVIVKRIQAKIDAMLGDVNIPDDVKHFELDDFVRLPQATKVLPLARQLAESDEVIRNGVSRPGFIVAGTTGTGKTSIAYVTFKARVIRGCSGAWVNFNDLIKRLRWTYKPDYSGPTHEEIGNALKTASFMVMDDLGSITRDNGKFAEDAIDLVRDIVEYRLNKRLPTIITTNLSREQLENQFGPRVYSRISGLCHGAVMVGKDMREVE